MRNLPVKTSLLIVANLALLAAVIWQILAGTAHVEALKTATRPLDLPEPSGDMRIAHEDLSIVKGQPLFHATRQYVEPVSAAAARRPPPNYVFAGAMMLPGSAPIGYLRHAQTNQSLKVRSGESVEGWTVGAIDSRSVVLENGGEQVSIGTGGTSAAPQVSGTSRGSGLTIVPAVTRAEPDNAGAAIRVLGAPRQSAQSPGIRAVQLTASGDSSKDMTAASNVGTGQAPTSQSKSADQSTNKRPRTYRPPTSN